MSYFSCMFAGALLGCICIFPSEAAKAAWDGLSLWAKGVVPSLGPAMALCLFLCSRFRGNRGLQVFSAFLCGSPGGAKMIQSNDYGAALPLRDAALTGVMSPGFFLGVMGLWLENQRAAIILYFCHVAGACVSALCIKKAPALPGESTALSLPECALQSVQALLCAGYFIMLGTVCAGMCRCALPFLPEGISILLQCLLEVTGGTKLLIGASPTLLYPLLCAATSFGGLSILMQNLAFWQEKGITFLHLCSLRLLHAAVSFLLCFLLQILSVFG